MAVPSARAPGVGGAASADCRAAARCAARSLSCCEGSTVTAPAAASTITVVPVVSVVASVAPTMATMPFSRARITVCEVGLLPGEDAVLAPDWVPWSERVSQEEKIRLDAIAAGEDPEKALARARGEADAQEQSADEGNADHDDPADLTDAGTDAADVDADSDAADSDAGDEPGAGEQPS